MLIYQKSHRRRPVYWGLHYPNTDSQGSIPAGWCCRCGSEIFTPGEAMCPDCRKAKGE